MGAKKEMISWSSYEKDCLQGGVHPIDFAVNLDYNRSTVTKWQRIRQVPVVVAKAAELNRQLQNKNEKGSSFFLVQVETDKVKKIREMLELLPIKEIKEINL